ncbi:S1 family peptidase [Oryzihumus leptocrescens]|uniref:Trypsin n=1 Tax=Oryzihumus leptocrescens TaxID=297536 RepID=A0A542ZNI3_9MICO|nr:S1 family peptidase [Oryzihumus leptocrescens]TQL61918.1 hypothetical protein FB474_3342 [Oryzihumus leptocrescens]
MLTSAAIGAVCLALLATAIPANAEIAAYSLPGGSAYHDGNPDNPDYACTIGLNVNNSSGDRVAITAGHCGKVGETEYVSAQLGTINRRVFGSGGDYAVIGKATGTPYTLPPRVITAKANGETLPVRKVGTPVSGDYICWTGGNSTYTHCGTIFQTNVATSYNGVTVQNTFRLTGCAHQGDSGGPMFYTAHDSATNSDYAVVVGIFVALSNESNCDARTVVGQPIIPIMKDFNLTLP